MMVPVERCTQGHALSAPVNRERVYNKSLWPVLAMRAQRTVQTTLLASVAGEMKVLSRFRLLTTH